MLKSRGWSKTLYIGKKTSYFSKVKHEVRGSTWQFLLYAHYCGHITLFLCRCKRIHNSMRKVIIVKLNLWLNVSLFKNIMFSLAFSLFLRVPFYLSNAHHFFRREKIFCPTLYVEKMTFCVWKKWTKLAISRWFLVTVEKYYISQLVRESK